MSPKIMSNAEKVQVATNLLAAVDSDDADGVSEVVVGLIVRNNPRLAGYSLIARVALAAVLRRLFGGEDDEGDEVMLEEVAKEAAVGAAVNLLTKGRDRDYAWYDPRGWF